MLNNQITETLEHPCCNLKKKFIYENKATSLRQKIIFASSGTRQKSITLLLIWHCASGVHAKRINTQAAPNAHTLRLAMFPPHIAHKAEYLRSKTTNSQKDFVVNVQHLY